MRQTPVHENHNPDLFALIPQDAAHLVEVGCSSGALAREVKRANPRCHYVGIDIDPEYAALARRYCDEVFALDIDGADDAFFAAQAGADAWIFGDTLEHLRDPWRVLGQLRMILTRPGASVIACIPNAQHWSVVTRLAIGDFRYENRGLLDRTHLRWFTRQTIIELFESSGFTISGLYARTFDEPARDLYLPGISALAAAAGVDPAVASADAMPTQYVVRAAVA
jgi:SAM-dependent methyltransferase